MEKWEYMTRIARADRDNPGVPDKSKVARFCPSTLEPEFDRLGQEGWELVHIQPVAVDGNLMLAYNVAGNEWSNAYFCAFKRRIT